MKSDGQSLLKYRLKLLALIGVFIAPFVGGWMALYVFDLRPKSINYGTLVDPVRKINWSEMKSTDGTVYENGFGRKWTFVLITRNICEDQCQLNLFYMKQIRTLLGRDTARLQNVLISTYPVDQGLKDFLGDFPNLVVIDNFLDDSMIEQFQTSGAQTVGLNPRLFLIDPDQNFMMEYPAQNDHYRVLDDIKKLLKLSQIG